MEPLKHYDEDWRRFASCKGEDPAMFFYEDTSPNHEARRMCYACPVRIDCLEYATEHEKDWGVWAGVTARVRLTLRRLMLRTKTDSVVELLSTKPEVVLEMYPAPRRTYRRNPDKPSPISTNEMFLSLIDAAQARSSVKRTRSKRG
jgi:WhiB family redox-sensing transcriptional regulator